MVLDFLKKRMEEAASGEQVCDVPVWVSSHNHSLKAWHYVENLKKEKLRNIKSYNTVLALSIQKNYQIKGAEIASALSISRASLMNTSKYSCYFRAYLDVVNQNLENAKEIKLKKVKKLPSRGSIRDSKDELVKANNILKKRVDQLEAQNTEKIVSKAFDQLPLPIKKKLGIS